MLDVHHHYLYTKTKKSLTELAACPADCGRSTLRPIAAEKKSGEVFHNKGEEGR